MVEALKEGRSAEALQAAPLVEPWVMGQSAEALEVALPAEASGVAQEKVVHLVGPGGAPGHTQLRLKE